MDKNQLNIPRINYKELTRLIMREQACHPLAAIQWLPVIFKRTADS